MEECIDDTGRAPRKIAISFCFVVALQLFETDLHAWFGGILLEL